MNSSFDGLESGLGFAILLVYLLMVVNFQSWLDPLHHPDGAAGRARRHHWILFLTGTTLSVPALIGSIMCVGVATANSILVVSFANEQRITRDARSAALAAGMTRLRPVMMTALAMVHRHAADGARARRGRRAECAAWPRGDRRAGARDAHDPGVRAGDV